jgi:hypothetical protein
VNVPVHLSGHTATWRFRDSARLDAWMTDQPWRQSGGVIVVRIAGEAQAGETATALGRAIRAADSLGNVQVHTLDETRLEPGLKSAVAESLGVQRGDANSSWLRRVARELEVPTVFVTMPTGRAPLEDAAWLRDIVPGLSRNASATFVLMDLPGRPLAPDHHDLSIGEPADGLLAQLRVPLPLLWRVYLHVRIAWELGGNPILAMKADREHGLAELPVGEDVSLEREFNRHADVRYGTLTPELRAALRIYLRWRADPALVISEPPGSVRDLEDEGLLWRPVGEQRLRPVGWLARVILRHDRDAGARSLLRSCLICAPLLREVLARCLNLESHDRTCCHPEPPPDGFSPNSERCRAFRRMSEQQSRFERGDPESVYCYYPAGCPAVPDDVWDFGSYDMILSSSRLLPARGSSQQLLKRLRNALAHGHYLSWQALLDLQQVENAIG